MAVVAAGYRKGLISAVGGCCSWLVSALSSVWSVLLLSCANGHRKRPVLSPCRGSISDFLGSFQCAGAFLGRRALTIERSVMSGCGQGHEPTKKTSEGSCGSSFSG